jgi:hypothetical protein
MNEAAAVEHLHTIRTLMERAAVYRRALAPMMLVAGGLGLAASAIGWLAPVESADGFLGLWLATASVALAAAFLQIRRQAIGAAEPFWTPPTRRVGLAALPPVFVGAVSTWLCLSLDYQGRPLTFLLPSVWLASHGLALHAAGFFMPRGIRWFGWGFVLAGTALGAASVMVPHNGLPLRSEHLVMGATFGLGHLAYGIYLRSTERKPAA